MVKPVYVHKIGGSVLNNTTQIQKIINSILSIYGRNIVVLSALYGITDSLQSLIDTPQLRDEKLRDIRSRHFDFLAANNRESDVLTACNIVEQMKHLEIDLSKYDSNRDPYVKARILSYGERLSVIVFNSLFSKSTIPFVRDPADFSLLTTNDPFSAQIISSGIDHDFLLNNESDLILIPGFYGYSNTGNLCLVGRGGTDYSAAAIARSTGAKKLYFWKDTFGVHSCNPSLNHQSISFPVISYRQAELLARGGAEILHPRVHLELQDSETEVVFCHPDFGLKEQTRLIRNKYEFGGVFLIDSEIRSHDQNNQKSSVLLVSRNIAGLVARLKQYKLTYASLKIAQIDQDYIRIEIHPDEKKELILNLHNEIYSSIDHNSIVAK